MLPSGLSTSNKSLCELQNGSGIKFKVFDNLLKIASFTLAKSCGELAKSSGEEFLQKDSTYFLDTISISLML